MTLAAFLTQTVVFCLVCALFAVSESFVRARVLMRQTPRLSAALMKPVRMLLTQICVPQNSAPFVFFALPAAAFAGVLFAFAGAVNKEFDLIGAVRSLSRLCAVLSVFPVLAAALAVSARSADFTAIQNAQKHVWFIVPHFPLFLIYMAGTLALTRICGGGGEREIARGVETEYTGAPYFVLRLTRLLMTVFACVVGAYLFLGGDLPLFGLFKESGGVWLTVKSAVLFALIGAARETVPLMKTGAFVKTVLTRVLPFCLFWLFASAGVCLLLTEKMP